MAKAKIANPGIFGDIQMAPVAYRFDNRSPRMVFDQGAFSPNPLKPRGTIEAHTLKQSKGTGSYVSCSLDSVPSFLDLAVERPPYPNFIGRRQEFKRESGSSNWSPSNPIHLITDEFTGDTEWEDMRKKEFRTNSMGGRGDGTAPEWLAWQFWEYRLQNVEGVPILGGNHAWEREFVTRGIILDDFAKVQWRKVLRGGKIKYSGKFGADGVALWTPENDVEDRALTVSGQWESVTETGK